MKALKNGKVKAIICQNFIRLLTYNMTTILQATCSVSLFQRGKIIYNYVIRDKHIVIEQTIEITLPHYGCDVKSWFYTNLFCDLWPHERSNLMSGCPYFNFGQENSSWKTSKRKNEIVHLFWELYVSYLLLTTWQVFFKQHVVFHCFREGRSSMTM